MNKAFTTREKIMLVFLVILAIGMAYYTLILGPINEKIANYDSMAQTEQAETETNMVIAQRVRDMEAELEELKASGNSQAIPAYDNAGSVMVELNAILSDSREYHLDFGAVTEDSYIMQRPVTISFQTKDYQAARKIVDQLHDSPNVNQISNLSIQSDTGKEKNTQVNLTITYFEIKQAA